MVDELLIPMEQVVKLTGYTQPAAQVAELRRQGFHRARRNPTGAVVLERAHYEAVCGGRDVTPVDNAPLLKSQRRKAKTS